MATNASAAVKYALDQVGDKYVFGADGPNAFDCSGLVMAAWKHGGLTLPHNSGQQAQWFKDRGKLHAHSKAAKNGMRPGDDVFWYGSTAHTGSISHCGIYVGQNKKAGYRRYCVAAVDEAHGVKYHWLYWALTPVGYGYVNHS